MQGVYQVYRKRPDKDGFTLIELLVVISIIAVLLSILMPALTKAKKAAKDVVCKSNLHQWGLVFTTFFIDNDGHTIGWPLGEETEEGPGVPGAEGWPEVLHEYYQQRSFQFCPEAKKDEGQVYGSTFVGWNYGWDPVTNIEYAGSYGINDWCYSPPTGVTTSWGFDLTGRNWGSLDMKGANKAPLFLDCIHLGSFPFSENDAPPPKPIFDGLIDDQGSLTGRYCLDRHGKGRINCLFMDASARSIGLKELWTLKWHRQWDTKGKYTLAGNGGVPSPDWPDWMRRFKDY